MVFQCQQSFSYDAQFTPVRKALDNWKLAWRWYEEKFAFTVRHCPVQDPTPPPDNMWKRIGFMRHAAEYWLLADLITRSLVSTPPGAAEEPAPGHGGGPAELHLVSREKTRSMLERYDENSMRQVNELIAAFQAAEI